MAGITEVAPIRLADNTVIWRTYFANRDEVCRALGIPIASSDEIDISEHDAGIEIIVKSVGNDR